MGGIDNADRETSRRLVPRSKPHKKADQREKAIYWRVNVMRLTQHKLARLLNVRRQTIIRIENGEQPITRMYRLACLGLQTVRPWDDDEWPYFGSNEAEEKAYRKMLQYSLEEGEME